MICKNNKTGEYFNYDFIAEDLVNVWNLDKKYGTNGFSKIIWYDTCVNEYTIIDKWKTINAY